MIQTRTLRAIAISILGLLWLGTDDVRASAFTVTPVRVFLGRGTNSALLTLKNDSAEMLRFQITLKAWNQTADGEMELSDTNDLVFFPTLMELKAGEERKVRIGSAFKSPVATERSYRIFFEELPPSQVIRDGSDDRQRGAQVRVLTKMGVPIFIQPATLVLKGDLTAVSVTGRKLQFEIRNNGNSFFSIIGAKVVGLSRSGTTTFERTRDGWYVLAGGRRRFEFEVPADACESTDHLRIEVSSSLADERGKGSTLSQDVPFLHGCGSTHGRQ